MAVKRRPGDSVDSMLRRFKKEVLRGEILKDLRKHEFYIPPSEKRRKKSAEAQRRLQKTIVKTKEY